MSTIISHTNDARGGAARARRQRGLRRVAAAPAIGMALLAASVGSAQAASGSVRTVKVGAHPQSIAISTQQSRGYVLSAGSKRGPGSVTVLNLTTHRRLAKVQVAAPDLFTIGLVPGDSEAYIGAFQSSSLEVLNTASLKLTGTVQVGPGATDVVSAQTNSGGYAYVTELLPTQLGAVAVVRTSDNQLVDTIPLSEGAQTAATSNDGQEVWVGSAITGTIWIIDTSTQKVVREITVPDAGPVTSIAFSPDGTRAWVYGMAGISVVDVATGDQVAFVPIASIFPNTSPNAGSIALTSSGRYALILNATFPDEPKRGTVAILDTTTLKVVSSVQVGTEPTSLALDTTTSTAYATNYINGTVSYFQAPN